MFALSFRIKLLLAMMLVVAGVSGATLYITERSVQEAYERLFNDKLESQIKYLPKEQEARLSNVKEVCQNLCRLVRFQAAFIENDADRLYLTAMDELGRFIGKNGLASGKRSEAAPDPAESTGRPLDVRKKGVAAQSSARVKNPKNLANARAREAVFLVFMDAKGTILQSEDPRAKAFMQSETRQKFQQQMSRLAGVISKLDAQQVGYFSLSQDKGKSQLVECIITPVIDSDTRQVIGAIALAFPFFDGGEQAISDISDIDNGTWADNHLYTHTIPESARAELERRLPQEIQRHTGSNESFIIEVAGDEHRVFYMPLNPDSPLPTAYKIGLYSRSGELKARHELRWRIVSFSGLAVLGALAASLLLSHGLAVPIRELVAGTDEIKHGNFDVAITVRSRDEIGQLASSFNEMAKDLALKEKYHDVLNKVADKDVAEQLMTGKLTLGGEMREANVLFCDIRGFTALTQNMNPAEVIHMLNEHMTTLTKVVNEHNGVVDKFIGDSIMAVFGAPKSYGNDAYNAARCALGMIQARTTLNQTSHYRINIGIGIATGPVLAGNMGSEDRLNYTVLGERVNLAARLCSVASLMEVVISEPTHEKLGSLVEAAPMADLKLKGFTDSVRAYKLTAVHSLTRT